MKQDADIFHLIPEAGFVRYEVGGNNCIVEGSLIACSSCLCEGS